MISQHKEVSSKYHICIETRKSTWGSVYYAIIGNSIVEGKKDCDDSQIGKECGGEYPYYFMKNKLTGDIVSESLNNVNFNLKSVLPTVL